jgi:hypothetical protein
MWRSWREEKLNLLSQRILGLEERPEFMMSRDSFLSLWGGEKGGFQEDSLGAPGQLQYLFSVWVSVYVIVV